MLPPDPDSCADARRTAEAQGDDAALLRLRQLERAYTALPPIIDGARRDRLVWADAISTVWTGWDVHSGARLVLRCLRPFWRDDPVMRRRLGRAAPPPDAGLLPLEACLGGDWPHLRATLPGPLLAEKRCADPAALAGVLASTLSGLGVLHAQGLSLGGDLLDQISIGDARPVLIWLDRFDPPGSPQDDLRAVGALAEAMDPGFVSPLGRQVSEWVLTPPPSADAAIFLLQRAMAATLLSERHRLLATHRRQRVRAQRTLLHAQVTALLQHAPPRLSACLAAPDDQPPTLLTSDGRTLRGGQGAELAPLPTVVSADGAVDVFACRALLRAARRHQRRDDARRDAVDAQIGGDDAARSAGVRWLKARLRLRSLALLLEKQVQSSSSSASR